jgi:hypothetical protein
MAAGSGGLSILPGYAKPVSQSMWGTVVGHGVSSAKSQLTNRDIGLDPLQHPASSIGSATRHCVALTAASANPKAH